jgi:dTDP-4-amino-4,6-dideoxy-D-galactose acyltransferase
MPENSLCQYLDWDSDFFGCKIARINANQFDQGMMENTLKCCRDHDIECIYFLAEAVDSVSIKTAEENKFHFVDIRVELELQFEGIISKDSIGGPLRSCNQDDIPILQAMAKISHRDSRFYSDGNFPNKICDALYEKWIERSCAGYANEVLIAEYQGRVAGYVSCHLGHLKEGSIGLLAVHPDFQGKGLGRLLVEGAIRWFADHDVCRATVVTQGKNYKAQRLYQRCGFVTKSVHVWYHWWRQIPNKEQMES